MKSRHRNDEGLAGPREPERTRKAPATAARLQQDSAITCHLIASRLPVCIHGRRAAISLTSTSRPVWTPRRSSRTSTPTGSRYRLTLLSRYSADTAQGPVILTLFEHYTEKQIFDVWRAQGSCTHRSTPAKRKAKMIEETGSSVDEFRDHVKNAGKIGSLPLPDMSLWTTGQPAGQPVAASSPTPVGASSPTPANLPMVDDESSGLSTIEEETTPERENAEDQADDIDDNDQDDEPASDNTPSSDLPTTMQVECSRRTSEELDIADMLAQDIDSSLELPLQEDDSDLDSDHSDSSSSSRRDSLLSVWSALSWRSDGYRHALAAGFFDRRIADPQPPPSPKLPQLAPDTIQPQGPVSIPSEGMHLDVTSWLDEAFAREAEDSSAVDEDRPSLSDGMHLDVTSWLDEEFAQEAEDWSWVDQGMPSPSDDLLVLTFAGFGDDL